MNTQFAILGIIFVTFLWGSWFQTVKYIQQLPVYIYICLMYFLSIPIVWFAILFFQEKLIPQGVIHEITQNIPLAMLILICGIIFGIAMQLQLSIVKRIGLILSTSVSATCSILGGSIISILFAGLPQGVSVSRVLIGAVFLICATITCQYAGVKRDLDQQNQPLDKSIKSVNIKDILLLILINLVLMSAYPLATSLGLKSDLNLSGFSSLTCMGVLVIGAFCGSFFFALFYTLHFPMWKTNFKSINKARIFSLALIAAFAHFGGNVLHAIFAPVVSVAIATTMGNSYHVWSYGWGLVHGEFKGAKKQTYFILGMGILLFICGVFLLSLNVV